MYLEKDPFPYAKVISWYGIVLNKNQCGLNSKGKYRTFKKE